MVLNIVLNLVLIPRIGVAGAATAALVGNTLLSLIGYFFLPQIAPIDHAKYFSTFVRVMLCGMAMGLIVYMVNVYSNIAVAIVVGAAVYTGMVFVTRLITKAEILEAVKMIKK